MANKTETAQVTEAPAPIAAQVTKAPAPIARLNVETRHFETLLNGGVLAPEVKKKYQKVIALAKVRSEWDANN